MGIAQNNVSRKDKKILQLESSLLESKQKQKEYVDKIKELKEDFNKYKEE